MTAALLCLVFAAPGSPQVSVAQFEADRDRTVDGLLVIAAAGLTAEDSSKVCHAVAAIRKISALRAAKAVPFLIHNITFKPTDLDPHYLSTGPLPTLARLRPCVHALAMIGAPGYPVILKIAQKKELDKEHVRCIAEVFEISLGKEQAKVYLQHYASSLPSDDAKNAIKKVIDHVGMPIN